MARFKTIYVVYYARAVFPMIKRAFKSSYNANLYAKELMEKLNTEMADVEETYKKGLVKYEWYTEYGSIRLIYVKKLTLDITKPKGIYVESLPLKLK